MDARLGRGLGHMRRLSDGGVALNVPHLVLEPGGSEGVRFFSLQLSAAAREASASITDLAPELTDFAQTAGAIAKLDLVISVDTAIAHLAGAMGKPVWIMPPFVPDWRRLLERKDSPWYPTARLFRQKTRGDWGPWSEMWRAPWPRSSAVLVSTKF
jgi:hypothetical protein